MPTVLIVEDEVYIRQFVAVNLQARGYNILEAANAEDGLQQIRKHMPNALVLDIKLPGMSGWDMLRSISADPELPLIPVIVMTASSLHEYTDGEQYTNIVQKLLKPVSVTDLLDAVRKIFG